MLKITEQEFDKLYPWLAGNYSFMSGGPRGVKEFESTYLRSKLWRLNNLYTVVNKYGKPVRFVMNWAQHVVYAASKQHSRVCILKSRQLGMSTFWLVSYFDDALFCPFLNIGLMAQGDDEAKKLLERTKFLWDKLSVDVKNFLGISLVKDNVKEFSLSNNSTIFIRVSFRSATLQRLHISEFGKIANANPDRAQETFTGTLQALARGNTGIIESTAEGNNKFKDVYYSGLAAKNSGTLSTKDFMPIFLPWYKDPDCVDDVQQIEDEIAKVYFAELSSLGIELSEKQKNFWIVQYRELGDRVYQEYPATAEDAFKSIRDGTYYSRLYTRHVIDGNGIIAGLAEPSLGVDVYFDLGVSDYGVLLFVQVYGKEVRIIDERVNDGYGLEYYLNEIKESGYDIRSLKLPHDIKVRELTFSNAKGRAKSRYQLVLEWMKANDVRWQLDVLKRYGILDGIDRARSLLKQNFYVDPKCKYFESCMLNYSKEWDARLEQWKATPRHDKYSHGADVMRSIATDDKLFKNTTFLRH